MIYYEIYNYKTNETISCHLTQDEVNIELGRQLKLGLPYSLREEK